MLKTRGFGEREENGPRVEAYGPGTRPGWLRPSAGGTISRAAVPVAANSAAIRNLSPAYAPAFIGSPAFIETKESHLPEAVCAHPSGILIGVLDPDDRALQEAQLQSHLATMNNAPHPIGDSTPSSAASLPVTQKPASARLVGAEAAGKPDEPGVTSGPASQDSSANSPVPAFSAGDAEEPGIATQHLLVVDDDDPVRNACCEIARRMGFNVHEADSVPSARIILKQIPVDLLLLDLKLPGGGGLLLLEETKALHPETVVVVMTAFATVSSAVEAMRIGAADYLTKPFALEELTAMLGRASQRKHYAAESRLLREKLRTQTGEGNIIGNSPEMEKLYRIVSKVAFSTHPVLILGESGTGKEMVARAIHFNGPNAKKPFVPVDCGSLVPTLIESELFGYVKGAFTGANKSKEGLLAAAEGGTVFLDEIGELPLDLQSKLLRALQEKEVRPVGATYAVPISARVLAATNRDLATMVAQAKFRKDLYFRLNVVNLKIPPLRDRREDIPVLAQHFLEKTQRETGRQYSFSDEALRLMTEFDWPGNVRELENAIERACALSSGPLLHMGDLPTQLQDFRMQAHQNLLDQRQQALQAREAALQAGTFAGAHGGMRGAANDTALTQLDTGEPIVSIAELEKQAILNTIRQLNGDKLMAARLLQIGKTTLYRKLKEYGIADGADELHKGEIFN